MKYFLVSNPAECLLHTEKYAGSHVPFVLNIHDFRYFDTRGIPFVTIGHFMGPRETRKFCEGYLRFLRRFVDEMDTRNAGVAKSLFDADIKLFSTIAYEIFSAFYGIFRFVACVHLMRTNATCEMIIPLMKGGTEEPGTDTYGLAGSFDNEDKNFKRVFDYFTDLHNFDVEKVFFTSSKSAVSGHRKRGIRRIIRSLAKKVYDIYAMFAHHRVTLEKCVLNMSRDGLWQQVLNSGGTGSIGIISVEHIVPNDKPSLNGDRPIGDAQISLFRTDYLQDEFMEYFRCKEFVQDLLFQRYEELLQRTVPSCKNIRRYFEKNEICAVVGNACGATFMNSLIGQLARHGHIPVVGMQHGGQYGYMDCFDKLGYSDYYACDYWFSWGFDNKYFENTFHYDNPARAEIIPVGSVEIAHLQKSIRKGRKRQVPIIYPIVNNIKLTWSTFRTDDFKLYNFQKRILEKLFASGREVLVKPHVAYPLALDDMLKNAPENISISTEPLGKIFAKYSFEWIIIDLLSTPFEQACVTQAQILAFNDSGIWPIETGAKQMMEKRAWIFEDEEDFLAMLDNILVGERLDKRLDDTFEKNFILPYGDRTDWKALTELEKIISTHGH